MKKIHHHGMERNTKLKEISISGITKIGSKAFTGCSSVSGTLLIPSTIKSIGIQDFIQQDTIQLKQQKQQSQKDVKKQHLNQQ